MHAGSQEAVRSAIPFKTIGGLTPLWSGPGMLNVNLTTLYDWAAAGVEKGAHPAAQLEAV